MRPFSTAVMMTTSVNDYGKLVQPLLPSYEKALQQASLLAEIERLGDLMMMNHYFTENVRKA
jgi:hypothetical protein